MHKLKNINIVSYTEDEKKVVQSSKASQYFPPDRKLSSIAENRMEEDINISIKNLADKLNLMPRDERLNFCEKEFLKVSPKIMAGKLSISNKPEMFEDYEAIYNFLKWEIATLKNPKITQYSGIPDWELMINPSKRAWFHFVKMKFISKLKTNVAKAAFAYVAIERNFIVENEPYINKQRKLVEDFCRSFFKVDVSSSILSGEKKQKNLLINKEMVRWIFKEKTPIDWII
jgi:hypothetical protein